MHITGSYCVLGSISHACFLIPSETSRRMKVGKQRCWWAPSSAQNPGAYLQLSLLIGANLSPTGHSQNNGLVREDHGSHRRSRGNVPLMGVYKVDVLSIYDLVLLLACLSLCPWGRGPLPSSLAGPLSLLCEGRRGPHSEGIFSCPGPIPLQS